MTESQVIQIIARLRKLEAKGREVKCEVDGIRGMLRDEFQERGTDSIKAGRYVARQVTYTRDHFDTAKFREQQPTAYKLYSKPVTVSKIDVVG